ncbi:hypothetical protein KC19_8G111600 [Ceratodon purpureus]|uniref:Uncharacterized protein n=1 Tax=Ceratodon purpureus TaxID=3225 RepID=A0A8T0GXP3_CERPU|nr:hypothetical protein KC19_8G111600 [Ceratodon purpureus]
MGSVDAADEPEDAGALSDFDEDEEVDAAPVELPPFVVPLEDEGKSVKELAAELEAERQARKVLEIAKAEGDANFVRLKALITEAARQRDEAYRLRDQAAREKEEVVRERDESVRAKEEVSRARDVAKTEIGEVARLLIGANDKVTSMAKGVKSFGRNLPASKYTGLQAIAFGFGKRVEEIVEEVLRQREAALSAQREAREQMEQRNYAVAIEVSELEASIAQLKEDVAKKISEVEVWKNQATIKDDKFLELEQVFSEKLAAAESESSRLRGSMQEVQSQLQSLKDEAGQHKEILREALKCIGKLRKGLLELPHELNFPSDLDESGSGVSDSANGNLDEKQSMPQQCLTELKALLELGTSIGVSWKEKKVDWEKTSHELVTRIGRLVGQKQDAADLLATALSEKQQVLETISDLRVKLSQENMEVERLQVTLKEAQEKGRESDEEEENEELVRIRAELGLVAQSRDEALSMVTALMNEINQLRQQIGELETALAQARSEVGELRTLSNAQVKELSEKAAQIKDILQQVKGYTADIESLEEEVERWKQAATDEAEAGAAVMEDLERCQFEVSELNKQIDRFKVSGEEAMLKLRSKEEMAAAAIAARTAAERSLQMADERAGELRERLEELNRLMEEADRNKDYRLGLGWLDMCCPWLRNRRRSSDGGGTQMAAEMEELLEPLV